ncbi:MAG: PDZ domain-containing protein [Francisellaceae bacterium]|nr:PDZ domain-containing protein [Francisellaceae bacterium]
MGIKMKNTGVIIKLITLILVFYCGKVVGQECRCVRSYADAVQKSAPAIVSIQTSKTIPIDNHPLYQDPFFRHFFSNQMLEHPEQAQHGLGSGVIIDYKLGYVLTNHHVIKDTDSIQVKLADNRVADAKIIGTDVQSDLAILKINLNKLPRVYIGSSSNLRVGDIVLAIGNPFGLEQTVTQGIVSALAPLSVRTGDNSKRGTIFDELIQTDAAINPGNSGGGLFDVDGNLIGINMAVRSASGGGNGVGFAIPIDSAKEIMHQLVENGHVVRGWLGAHLQALSEQMKSYLGYKRDGGVYIQAIIHGSPAQHSGLLPGDIVTQINNIDASNIHVAISTIKQLNPNETYRVEVYRKGKFFTIDVKIGELD